MKRQLTTQTVDLLKSRGISISEPDVVFVLADADCILLRVNGEVRVDRKKLLSFEKLRRVNPLTQCLHPSDFANGEVRVHRTIRVCPECGKKLGPEHRIRDHFKLVKDAPVGSLVNSVVRLPIFLRINWLRSFSSS